MTYLLVNGKCFNYFIEIIQYMCTVAKERLKIKCSRDYSDHSGCGLFL